MVVSAPKSVRELLAGAISRWDPRKRGAIQRIEWQKEHPALLYGEKPSEKDVLECVWALDRDPKTARKYWKVAVGPPELVAKLEKAFSYHFDDPLDVR